MKKQKISDEDLEKAFKNTSKWLEQYENHKGKLDKKEISDLLNSGLSQSDIARMKKVSVSTVNQLVKRHGLQHKEMHYATKDNIDKVKELIDKGYQIDQIVGETGISRRSICNWIKKYDLRNKEGGCDICLDKSK